MSLNGNINDFSILNLFGRRFVYSQFIKKTMGSIMASNMVELSPNNLKFAKCDCVFSFRRLVEERIDEEKAIKTVKLL